MAQTKYLKGECQHCRGHIEFPAEAAGTVADCPHCGRQTDLLLAAPPEEPTVPRRVWVTVTIAVIILVAGLIGSLAALKRAQKWAARQKSANSSSTLPTNTSPVPQITDPAVKAGFRATPVHIEKAAGSTLVYAVGTITNPQDKQRFGVRVELDLFNAAGAKIGTAKDYQQVIEPRGQWQFKALVVDSKAASAKISSLVEEQ